MTAAFADRFVLEESVGRGAFAEVFRARDLRDGGLVALKRLHPGLADDPIARERFVRECRLLARVSSPHVVSLVAQDAARETTHPWMALAWLEGSDLSRTTAQGRVEPGWAVTFARQAAEGLDALHRAGIVHRDVKPSNFIVTSFQDGSLRATLIDLGVGRAPEEREITLDGLRIGTPSYMSPEQARGESLLSPRSDLYSLGVVLYELLAGRKPFGGADPFSILARVLLEDPPPLSRVDPALPEPLCALVARAMARDPERRFPSARAMAEALDAIGPLAPRVEPAPGGGSGEDAPTAQLRISTVPRGAERRVVTVLLADLSESGDPAEALAAFESITEQHRGVAHRVVGRRAIAVFGAARTQGDEPVRAARAALATLHEHEGTRLALATARTFGGPLTIPMEAVEQSAVALDRARGAVALDEDTARALRAHFEVDGDEGAWVLRGERSSYTVVAARVNGRTVPLVGREREIETLLDAALRAAENAVPAAALVTGPPGIGKSRLRAEFLTELTSRRHTAQLAIRCDPMLQDVPFGALGRALRHRAMVEPDDISIVREAALARWIRALDARVDLEVLRALAGMTDAPELSLEDGGHRRAALREGLGAVLRALGRPAGESLVVLVEDLQWLDDATADAIAWALEDPRSGRLFVLGLGRPECALRWPRLWDASVTARVELGPLSARASEQLAREALGPDASDARVRAIADRATGNPLFIEELVRASGAEEQGLPLAIQAAFQERLDALAPEARRAAMVASALGAAVWPGALAAMEPSLDVDAALAALVHAEVLAARRRARLGRDREYVWRHGLLRESAYAMLTAEDSARIHGAAARWLEAAGERDDAVIAEHLRRAGAFAQASERFLLASRKALREGAHGAVVNHAERALSLPDVSGSIAAGLRSVATAALHRAGRYDEALAHTDAALALAPARELALILTGQRALTLRRTGRAGQAAAEIARVLAARTEGEDAARVETLTARRFVELESVWLYLQTLDFGTALAAARALVRALPEEMDAALTLGARHALAQTLYGADQLEEALRAHRAVVSTADELGLRWRSVGARVGTSQCLLALGLTDAGLREAEHALAQAREAGLPSAEGFALHQRGRALARLGRTRDADEAQRAAEAVAERLRNPALLASALAARAGLAVGDGLLERAIALAERALAIEAIPRGWGAAALAARGWARARQGERGAATEDLAAAVSRLAGGAQCEGGESALAAIEAGCAEIDEKTSRERARSVEAAWVRSRLEGVRDGTLRTAIRAREGRPAGGS